MANALGLPEGFVLDQPETLTSTGRVTPEGRPIFTNPQGQSVTERTITENIPELGGVVNIPTVFEGRFLSPDEAIQKVIESGGKDPITGRKLQVFSDIPTAVESAKQRSAVLGQQIQGLPAGFQLDQPQDSREIQVAPTGRPIETGESPALAALETAGTIASGIIAEPVAGIAGLLSLPFTDAGKATENIEAVREALTFVPRTPEGMRMLQNVAEAIQPVGEFLQEVAEQEGEAGFQAAGPIGGAVGQTLPTVAATALGLPVTRTAARLGQLPKVPIEGTLRQALQKGTVLTTDVSPPKTFVGKAFQKVTERVPVLGTGKVRAAQQETRIDALKNLSREFDVDPGTSFEADIVKSANEVFKRSQNRAAALRTEAVTELKKLGDIEPANALKAIDDEITKVTALGERGDQALLGTLQNIKGELAGDFERLKNIRTTIFDDISDMGAGKSPMRSGSDAALSNVAGALSKDLDDFAVNAAKTAGQNKELAKAANKWKASNRIFKDNFAKAKETELKRALTKGKVQPEIIGSTIRGGKKSELTRLHNNLDLKGRQAVKQQILSDALERANGNPTRFLNEMNRVNNRRAVDIFFKGKDRKELEGVKRFLDITRRAQEEAASIATQQEVTTLGLLGGAAVAPKPVLGAAATIGVLGRGFESAPARNLLLKLSNLPPASKKAKDIANQITLLIAEAAQAAQREE